MADITVSNEVAPDAWENFLATHPEANFLQSVYWEEFQKRLGRTVHRIGWYRGGQLAGAMLAIVEPARRGRYLSVPGGPILDWQDPQLVDAWVTELKRLAKQEGAGFVRVRPQLTETEFGQKLFARYGFRRAQMHLHAELTSQLDITREDSELLNNFRKNTRYELKQAKKRGIKISQTTDPEAIDEFYDLQLKTAQRHGFVPYGHTFLKEQFKVFAEAGKAVLYSSHTADGKLIAQAYVIFYNQEAAYHYGASTELGRQEPGAVLVQWTAIREAKTRGLKRYNFWGVVKPEETKHRFYGVSVFKRGFRGEDVEYLHARDLVISWPRYLINYAVEAFRKRVRHL